MPGRRGFGSRVIETTVRNQLSGQLEQHWTPAGLVCDIALPLDRAVLAEEEEMAAG
jgi:two-component sensor histidine kinase